jgi:hypothetical protein
MPEFGYHDLERAALGFVLESESWPVFIEWMRKNHISDASHEWLEKGPDLNAVRKSYIAHNRDEIIRFVRKVYVNGQPIYRHD